MTVKYSPLLHQFTVGLADSSVDIDTQINITKRREEVIYRSVLDPNAVNIAFVSGNSLSSDNNISITDRSISLSANRVQQQNFTTVNSVDNFSINTENFVVTDVFTEETETIKQIPLFFKHILSGTNIPRDSNGDLLSSVSLIEVSILDTFLQSIRVEELNIDYNKGIIYNNLSTDYQSDGDYTVYYIKYVINNNGSVYTYLDLLDNVNVYQLASFDDLNDDLTIKIDRKVYILDETISGFTVYLPIVGTYAFKSLSGSKIRIVAPVPSSISDPWFVRITNGKFTSNIAGNLRKYHIAEFLSQAFYPTPPIKRVIQEESTILNKTLIKLDYDNVKEDSDMDLYVNILINGSDDTGIVAFTTDSSIVGNIASNGQPYRMWNVTSRYGIKSIDHKTGLLDIEGLSMKTSWKVFSSYYYEENKYEFTLIDLNPINNKKILSQRISLFIDPDSTSSNKTQTLYYLKIDETGKVIESNWDEFDNNTISMPSGIPLYYESYPEWYPSGIHEIFIDKYTVEGNNTGDFLVLGDLTVASTDHPAGLEKFDSRRRGGGIIDTKVSEALVANPEVQWYWDEGRWDGIPYPGNASYYVEVPVDVLDGAGGEFTQHEVKDIINRHTALGVYAVAKVYGAEVLISGIYPGGTSITIEWNGNEY